MEEIEPYVPLESVADHFSVSVSTVRMWVRRDRVPYIKVGGVYRLKLSEVEAAHKQRAGHNPELEQTDN